MLAKNLLEKKMGTLLFDLLTEEEDEDYSNRFDINLFSKRLAGATEWLEKLPVAKACCIGYFGFGTGAASALQAAGTLPQIGAVVCCGGNSGLPIDILSKITAPTLLIAGSFDKEALEMNKEVYQKLECEKQLEMIEGASYLCDEPDKMEIVSEIAGK